MDADVFDKSWTTCISFFMCEHFAGGVVGDRYDADASACCTDG